MEEILKHQDLDVNLTQEGGKTPLHWAAEKGNGTIVRLLLDNGADINAQTDDGNSPLSLARNKGIAKILERCRAVQRGAKNSQLTSNFTSAGPLKQLKVLSIGKENPRVSK